MGIIIITAFLTAFALILWLEEDPPPRRTIEILDKARLDLFKKEIDNLNRTEPLEPLRYWSHEEES